MGTRHKPGKEAGELRKDPRPQASSPRGDPLPPGTLGPLSAKQQDIRVALSVRTRGHQKSQAFATSWKRGPPEGRGRGRGT